MDARPKTKGRGRKKAVRYCFLDWNQFQYILLWLWLDSDTRHLEAEASVDRQTNSQLDHPLWNQHLPIS
jgi:hypothetical protein